MGRKHKQRSQVKSPAQSVQAVATTTGGQAFFLAGGGYQAAGQSMDRGYLYWPTTDTRRQMTSLTRNEILRRIQWLYVHFGFCRRLVNGMARLLGYLVPLPNSSDEEWNELAHTNLMMVMGQAEIWDMAGKFDAFMGQVQDNISKFRDGDCLAVLTETDSGRARLAYYEAHQIKNGPDSSGPGWVDGVLVGRGGKHLAYSVQDGEDPTKFVVIPARDAIYIGRFENRGQVRAISILTSAVLNMVDVVETRGFTKTKIKNSARMGIVAEQDVAAPERNPVGGFGGPEITGTAVMPNGSEQPVNFELVMTGQVAPKLPPGVKVKVLTDDNPSQNGQDFEKALLTDCCYANDLSYNTLCDVSSITGPGIRFLNEELKRWVLLQRYPQAKMMSRLTIWALAKEMKTGRLRKPTGDAAKNWWLCIEWLGLADMTIDGGRNAAATLTDLKSGQTTWADEWASKGKPWKNRIRQGICEHIYVLEQCRDAAKKAGFSEAQVNPQVIFPDRYAITSAVPVLSDGSTPGNPGAVDAPNTIDPSEA